jgi:hypothetical protein
MASKVDEVQKVRWHAQPDDTIGGWCVTYQVDDKGDWKLPSEGAMQIANFCYREIAEYIARIHNERIRK